MIEKAGGKGMQNDTEASVPVGYEGSVYTARTFANMTTIEVAMCLEDAVTVLNDQETIQDYFLEADMSIDMPWNERAADFLAWLRGQTDDGSRPVAGGGGAPAQAPV